MAESADLDGAARILVATDFSEASRQGVLEGARLSRALGVGVLLVHAVEDRLPPLIDAETRRQVLDQHRGRADGVLHQWAAELCGGLEVEVGVEQGDPAHVIRELAERYSVQMIVVTSRGHSALGGMLLGSTTDRLVRHAPCPVLVVPA
ncbi:MAG TPA: universal stress protein [Thermoanaerobaculia bacterium]|nr:universal stress protein [Thermoanaerobaculia bacterium]